ncbi:MAG: pyridoxamine 5'-phosphate oxidase family protein [Candidatus Rokubacteria bacterium]|nr:pyridoxamine 5'-phosphate oxidase family protein [Candidatus Rokubacteria bacterium]
MAKPRTARRPRPRKLTKKIAAVVQYERVCRVATAGARGMPHVVPVCHVLVRDRLYFGSGNDARKVLNLRDNAQAAAVIDVYTDAWPQLRGVLLQGPARIIARGPEFHRIKKALYAKYPQYAREAALAPSDSVIVEITPRRVFSWGFDGG